MAACSAEWSERLSAARDGELDEGERALLASHLETCAACQAQEKRYAQLGGRLAALRATGEVPPKMLERAKALGKRPAVDRTRWLLVAAGVTLALFSSVWALSARSSMPTALVDDLEAHHFKAFTHASPCEFESSDPTAVHDWLRENVGYEVDVPSLEGAELLGARRCKLEGVLTASVLFRREGQGVTVFLPAMGAPAESAAERLVQGAGCTKGRLGEICGVQSGARAGFLVAERDVVDVRDALGR